MGYWQIFISYQAYHRPSLDFQSFEILFACKTVNLLNPMQFLLHACIHISCLRYTLYRLKSLRMSDSRIKIMSEVLSSIRVIKMYTWEYPFKNMVDKIRKYV